MSTSADLPDPPIVDAEALAHSDAAQEAVRSLVASLDDDVARLARRMMEHRSIEAIAGVGAIDPGTMSARWLIPPRRRHLSARHAARFDGVSRGMEHIRRRIESVRAGALDHVIARETPMVLNAMVAAAAGHDDDGEAGLIRRRQAGFVDHGAVFVPPDPEHCEHLYDRAIDGLRAHTGRHPLELAAWITMLMFTIHPFVDGNGRTARLMFTALHAGDSELLDIGAMEAWTADRRRYISAIERAAPAGEPNSVAGIVPSAFAEFAVACSIVGAERWRRRIDHIASSVDGWRSELGEAVLTYAFIRFERNVTRHDLCELAPEPRQIAIAEELVRHGLVIRTASGAYSPAT